MGNPQLHHASIVVTDLEAAIGFFTTLGLELEGRAPIEGDWVDRINGIDGLRIEIAMLRTPDGDGRLEVTQFHDPEVITPDPSPPPPNALGLRSVMFVVDDVDTVVEALRAHGGEPVGETVNYEDVHRLCYVRGPGGVIVALSQDLIPK